MGNKHLPCSNSGYKHLNSVEILALLGRYFSPPLNVFLTSLSMRRDSNTDIVCADVEV